MFICTKHIAESQFVESIVERRWSKMGVRTIVLARVEGWMPGFLRRVRAAFRPFVERGRPDRPEGARRGCGLLDRLFVARPRAAGLRRYSRAHLAGRCDRQRGQPGHRVGLRRRLRARGGRPLAVGCGVWCFADRAGGSPGYGVGDVLRRRSPIHHRGRGVGLTHG